jgi:predicted DNA binding CopG/RHH family protein
MSHLRRWLAVIAVIVFITLAWWTFYLVHTSLEAERTLQAYRVVLDELTSYLKDSRAWPKDWQSLHNYGQERGVPRNRSEHAEIEKRVTINFNATVDDIARMQPDDFTAVAPIGPNYGPDEARINELLDAARQVVMQDN